MDVWTSMGTPMVAVDNASVRHTHDLADANKGQAHLHELLPVARAHSRVVQLRDQGQRGQHGLDGCFQHPVNTPLVVNYASYRRHH